MFSGSRVVAQALSRSLSERWLEQKEGTVPRCVSGCFLVQCSAASAPKHGHQN